MSELASIFPWWFFCVTLIIGATSFGILMKYLGDKTHPNLVGCVFSFSCFMVFVCVGVLDGAIYTFSYLEQRTIMLAICAGCSYVGVDVAIVKMYQNGAPISLAMPIVRAGLAMSSAIIGVLFFMETLTWLKIIGVLLTVFGIVLSAYKKKKGAL